MSARRVIVGVDRLDRSGAALDWAAREAADAGERLVVAHVVSGRARITAGRGGGSVPGGDRMLTAAVTRARERLADDRIQPVLRSGSPGQALVDLAYREDILVVGAAASPRWPHPHSTIDHVLGRALCPVVIVAPPSTMAARAKARPGPPGDGFAGSAGDGFAGQVVVGVDDSAAARSALSFGWAYAARHRLGLVVLHVAAARPAGGPADAIGFLAGDWGRLGRELPPAAHRELVLLGEVGPTLVAAGSRAALLVVGGAHAAHGRSIAHHVVDAALGPVAVVRPQ